MATGEAGERRKGEERAPVLGGDLEDAPEGAHGNGPPRTTGVRAARV